MFKPTVRWWPPASMWRVKGDTTSASLSGRFTRARRTGRPALSQKAGLSKWKEGLQCLKLDQGWSDAASSTISILREEKPYLCRILFVGSWNIWKLLKLMKNVAMSKQHWGGTIPMSQLVPRTFQFLAKVKTWVIGLRQCSTSAKLIPFFETWTFSQSQLVVNWNSIDLLQ